MICQLETMRRLQIRRVDAINNPPYPVPPLPEEDNYDDEKLSGHLPLYGYLSVENTRRLRKTSSEMQQQTLRYLLQQMVDHVTKPIRDLEDHIGDGTEVLEEHEENACDELPTDISVAAMEDNVVKVLEWLGSDGRADVQEGHQSIIPHKRINAKNPNKLERTLLHEANAGLSFGLMSILMQYGADVNCLSATRTTPLLQSCSSHWVTRINPASLLLLEWGADKDIAVVNATEIARENGYKKLWKLMKSPLGGRRCEILGLQTRSDLNGRTGVVVQYFPKGDRYAVRVEGKAHEIATDDNNDLELVKIKSINLKRRDRTPEDPGIVYKFCGYNTELDINGYGAEYV